jgi:polysaccharide biosynthesis transport protein
MSEQSLSSFFQAWRFRKWYFIIPALLIPLLSVILAFLLPPVFESKSTILIEEQQIPQDFVRSTVSGYAEQHVQILTQQILSRTKLWEIVEKFNLYTEERRKDTKENILEQMRKDIKFETISAEVQDKKKGRSAGQSQSFTIAFSISYQGRNPEVVQKVTNTLISLYLEQNLKYREEQAQTTTKFLEAELKDLKDKIEVLGVKIAGYKEKHPGTLPELRDFNLNQASTLETELKRLDGEIQAAQSQRIYLEGLIGTTQAGKAEVESGAGIKDPRKRFTEVNEELKSLRAKFSEDHPEVQRLAKEKTQLEQFLKGRKGDIQSQWRLAQLQADLAAKQGKYSEQHPEIKKLKNEIAQLLAEAQKGNMALSDVDLGNPAMINIKTQIQQLINQISTLTQVRQKQQEKLAQFRQRLEDTPKVEQEYLALQRDYQNAHTKYQEVMNKLMEARISEGMEQHQKGEKFTLIDPASMPEEPIKPKKMLIILAGLFLGIGVGAACMIGRENFDTSIKNVNELGELTKMAPLGIIARITSPFDQARQRRRRKLVVAATLVSVLLVITFVHFFYMDLWIIMSRIQRVIDRL